MNSSLKPNDEKEFGLSPGSLELGTSVSLSGLVRNLHI